MRRGALAELTGISIEGGALSTSVLQDLMARKLPESAAASYHIEEGYTVGERVAEDWNRVRSAWKALRKEAERLGAEPGAGVTRDRFLLPLFERLGYGRLAYSGGLESRGERFAISHQWGDVPVHLVGMDTDLDSRTEGRAGAARRSPHGLVLEYLNRGTANPWGFVANGKRLRLLRENRSIVRQSYIEFDLECILEGESFADFTALWLLCHQSRLEGKGDAHILERWRGLGIKSGERALDELRVGMEKSIAGLGSGFIAHPANTALREALRKGAAQGGLDTDEFYHELLRLAYRLIFLFVAEDREVLLDPKAQAEARRRYAEHYSTRRLRDLALTIRGGGHGDLWRGAATVMDLLADSGCADLGLPALGSFLWERESIAHLADSELANRDFLGAIRDLAFTRRNEALWPTDFRNLGSEELGSVYESLLELHTVLNLEGGVFQLATAAGHERKTTGSYYTPTELVERLLDEALDPVIARALGEKDSEAAILNLKVCDPAMGSGHFLAGAARRLAKVLASVRTGDPEPGPEPLRHAMADVIQHCVYGVDLNPLAVELCKISLWMEALEPGRPLSFLDHHLKCGNSLVGATRELMKKGIPEGAFAELTGDDKATVRAAKKRNAEEQRGERGLFDLEDEPFPDYGKIAERFTMLGDLDESTLEGVRLLSTRYRCILEAPEYLAELSAANLWCAAFFQPKRPDAPEPITQGRFSACLKDPTRVPKVQRELAESLAARIGFFHWELAFPEVFRPAGGKAGGFDVVLGNPPWDQVQFESLEWFSIRDPSIANAQDSGARAGKIEQLRTSNPSLYLEYYETLHGIEAFSAFIKQSGRFPLCGSGKMNLYSVFSEFARSLLSPAGNLGIIVPSDIATSDSTKDFFADLVQAKVLISLYDFENREKLFPAVDSRQKFSLLTISGASRSTDAISRFIFFAHSVTELEESERLIELTNLDFLRMNPNTKTAPIFRSRHDSVIAKDIYSRIQVLVNENEGKNAWGLTIRRLFNMGIPAVQAKCSQTPEGPIPVSYLKVYEAKMIHQYDHRFAGYAGAKCNEFDATKKSVGAEVNSYYMIPRSEVIATVGEKWDRDWMLVWRDICRSTDERTMIASVIPHSGPDLTLRVGFSVPEANSLFLLLGNFNSFCLDYIARTKIGSTHLSDFITKQLPVLPPSAYSVPCPWERSVGTVGDWIRPRVLELVYTSRSLEPFARDLGYAGEPFGWDTERRFALRCELDAAFFHLYGIGRDDADYIMETFPIVKRHDVDQFGEYRTKRVILERYEEYRDAMRCNAPEEFILESPAAKPIPQDGFPPVPALPTLATVLEYLSRLGVEVDNKRSLGGSLWVYRSKGEFGKLADYLEKSGVGVKFYPEGRKSRAGEQWEIDPGKRLG